MFREQCQFLLIDGPYSVHTEPAHIAVVFNWMGPHSYQIFNNLTFLEDKDKEKLIDALEVFGGHFKPAQSVLQSWYQLGSVYSSQCKDQTEFLNKLKDVAADCSFSKKEEMIKFLFLIHNTNEGVKDYLIEHMKPENTLADVLHIAKTVKLLFKWKLFQSNFCRMSENLFKPKYMVSISSRNMAQEVQIQI